MANYEITAPNGKRYRVTGQGSPEEAMKALQGKLSSLGNEQPQGGFDPSSVALPDVNLREARALGNQKEYENLPGWQKPIVALDDIVTILGDSASYGFAPMAAAKIRSSVKGTTYENERAAIDRKIADSQDRAGLAGTAASIAGTVAVPEKLAARGVTAASLPKVGGAIGLTVDGAAMGAADAYGHDQDPVSGAMFGGLFGAGAQVAGKAIQKIISPFKGNPQRTMAAQLLKKEGVELTAGQKTGNKSLRYAEGEMGGSAASDFMEKQGEQFTRAALKRTGENAPRATPEVIDKAFNRIGNDFNQLSARNTLMADPQIAQELTQVAVDYGSVVAPSMQAPVVKSVINDTLNVLQSQGGMAGKAYQKHASRLRTMARSTKDPELKQALNGIVESLDSAMERSIARANPNDLGAWSQARRQYRNMMVVEQAATGAGENAASGIISPSHLRAATVTKHGRRNYARGQGDFAELARAGEATMKPLPDSGTASRLRANMVPQLLGAGVGAGYGGSENGASGAVIGGLAGAAAPWAVGKALMSGPVRNYLGNQSANAVSPQTRQAIARMLMMAGISGSVSHQ